MARRPHEIVGQPVANPPHRLRTVRLAGGSGLRNWAVADVRCAATTSGDPLAIDPPATAAAFRPEIDHAVGAPDDVEIVLDDDHRVALVDEFVEHVEQLAHVLEVQAGGRLVEDVERAAGARRASSRASLTRCASPPHSVVADWPSSM